MAVTPAFLSALEVCARIETIMTLRAHMGALSLVLWLQYMSWNKVLQDKLCDAAQLSHE